MYKAIIFDLFGTLLDFPFNKHNKCLLKMSKLLKIERKIFIDTWKETYLMQEEGVFDSIESNLVYIIKKLRKTIDNQKIEKATIIRKKFTQKILKAPIRIINTLKSLKKDYSIGLITNCPIEVFQLWQTSNIASLFDCAVFSSQIKIRKPNKAIYLEICNKLNLKADDCIYIGDGGSNELEGAQSINMLPILLKKKNEKIEIAQYLHPNAKNWKGKYLYKIDKIQIDKNIR